MTKPAAITAELVDVRNVGMHKCIKLTLHVPAERAAEVIAAFGWATAVDPVPVALARLTKGAGISESFSSASREAAPLDADPPPPAFKPRPAVAPDKRLVQRAGILSNDHEFQLWLKEANTAWRLMEGTDEEKAAMLVRVYCGVKSRKEIKPGTEAARLFDEMLGKYAAWHACLEDVEP